jgi:hypothetical protein
MTVEQAEKLEIAELAEKIMFATISNKSDINLPYNIVESSFTLARVFLEHKEKTLYVNP